MTTTNSGTSSLTMAELRGLVRELNSDRERIARALALSDDAARSDVTEATARAQVRYEAVVSALERVAEDRYGICDRCGENIPFGRLVVMPEVTHCVACQRP